MTLHADKHAHARTHTRVVYAEESKQCRERRDLVVFPQGKPPHSLSAGRNSFGAIFTFNHQLIFQFSFLPHSNLQTRLNRGEKKKKVVIAFIWRMDKTRQPIIRKMLLQMFAAFPQRWQTLKKKKAMKFNLWRWKFALATLRFRDS